MDAFLPEPDRNALGAPARPSGGILGSVEGWEGLERDAERAYLGTLMLWKPGSPRAAVRLSRGDFSSDLRGDLLVTIRSLFPWEDSTAMERALAASLSRRYGLKSVQSEIADCLCLSDLWQNVDSLAERVTEGHKRRQRAALLREMQEHAHDPEMLAELWARMAALG